MVTICGKRDVPPGTPGYDICIAGAIVVVPETSYGLKPSVGISNDYARADHTHGTPPAPGTTAASTPKLEVSLIQTSNKSVNAVYQNTTGHPIFVAVSVSFTSSGSMYPANSCSLSIGPNQSPSVEVARVGVQSGFLGKIEFQMTAIVPSNYYYGVIGSPSEASLINWTELQLSA